MNSGKELVALRGWETGCWRRCFGDCCLQTCRPSGQAIGCKVAPSEPEIRATSSLVLFSSWEEPQPCVYLGARQWLGWERAAWEHQSPDSTIPNGSVKLLLPMQRQVLIGKVRPA